MSGRLHVPDSAGVVATLVRAEQVAATHVTGPPNVALRKVARLCDRYGWKVRCLSSPATIYRDLDGSRLADELNRVDPPEASMLAKIGRGDLLYGR